MSKEHPVEVVLNALAQARELFAKCAKLVREQPDMFRGINDFIALKVLNDSVRSKLIDLDGATSVALGKKYPGSGNPLWHSPTPAQPPEHQPVDGPDQAVLNEIDQTP